MLFCEKPRTQLIHCCSQNLSLSLTAFCNVSLIDKVLEVYTSITIHFNSSPKKEKLLEHIVITRCESIGKRKVSVGKHETRWFERDVSYEHFYLALPFIEEALEIINGTHPSTNTCDEIVTKGWDSNSKREATAYIIVGFTSFCIL